MYKIWPRYKTLICEYIISNLIFEGLQCYRHDFCRGSCPELEKTIVNCAKEEKCWVNIFKVLFFVISNLFLEIVYSGWRTTWLWYVFNIFLK